MLEGLPPSHVAVVLKGEEEAEGEGRGSGGGKKPEPRGRWQAIDQRPGEVWAYGFGRRKDEGVLQLQALLEPFGLTRYETDSGGAYERTLLPVVHSPGQRNTQQIERKPLTFRTRIKGRVRKTICLSKVIEMHDLASGLFMNRSEFGLPV